MTPSPAVSVDRMYVPSEVILPTAGGPSVPLDTSGLKKTVPSLTGCPIYVTLPETLARFRPLPCPQPTKVVMAAVTIIAKQRTWIERIVINSDAPKSGKSGNANSQPCRTSRHGAKRDEGAPMTASGGSVRVRGD